MVLPAPVVRVSFVPQTQKGYWEQVDTAVVVVSAERDGKKLAWSGVGSTNEEALQRLVLAMLDDPMTAEYVKVA